MGLNDSLTDSFSIYGIWKRTANEWLVCLISKTGLRRDDRLVLCNIGSSLDWEGVLEMMVGAEEFRGLSI